MQSYLPPIAWIGYDHDKKTGEFFVKICDKCEGFVQAKREAKKLAIKIVPCIVHFNESLNKQIK